MRYSANSVWENNERPAGEFAGNSPVRETFWPGKCSVRGKILRGRMSCGKKRSPRENVLRRMVPRGERFGRQKNWQLVDINQKEMR